MGTLVHCPLASVAGHAAIGLIGAWASGDSWRKTVVAIYSASTTIVWYYDNIRDKHFGDSGDF
jgi:hypothetical protein